MNGSAQTEQIAAIFSRFGVDAVLREQRLRLGDDARRPLGAVGQVGALVAVGGDEDAVEALLRARSRIQAGLIPLVHGQADDDDLGRVVHVRAPREVDARDRRCCSSRRRGSRGPVAPRRAFDLGSLGVYFIAADERRGRSRRRTAMPRNSWPTFPVQAAMSSFVCESLDQSSRTSPTATRAHRLLRLEQRARAGGAACVDDLRRRSAPATSVSVSDCGHRAISS